MGIDISTSINQHGIAWILNKNKAEDINIECPECKMDDVKNENINQFDIKELNEFGTQVSADFKCGFCGCKFSIHRRETTKKDLEEF